MADLSITAANVGVKGAAQIDVVQVGEAVTHAQPVYLSTDGKWYKADANVSVTTAAARGITMGIAALDGYVAIVRSGAFNPGATLTVGETYFVSATAGGIAPAADVTTGWFPTILGIASSASQLDVNIVRGTVARA